MCCIDEELCYVALEESKRWKRDDAEGTSRPAFCGIGTKWNSRYKVQVKNGKTVIIKNQQEPLIQDMKWITSYTTHFYSYYCAQYTSVVDGGGGDVVVK